MGLQDTEEMTASHCPGQGSLVFLQTPNPQNLLKLVRSCAASQKMDVALRPAFNHHEGPRGDCLGSLLSKSLSFLINNRAKIYPFLKLSDAV